MTTLDAANDPASDKSSRFWDYFADGMIGPSVVMIISAIALAGHLRSPEEMKLHDAELSLQDAQIDLAKVQGELREIEAGNAGFAKGFLVACGDPCRIRNNYGGYLGDYRSLAKAILASGRSVIIDGDCVSGCAMMADLARSNVLITRRASFSFHNSSNETPQPTSADIDGWIKSHGGYPSFASGKTTDMDFDDARRFWRPAFDWYREPRRIDAPWHWPNDPMGFSNRTVGVSVLPGTWRMTFSLTPYESLRGTVQ